MNWTESITALIASRRGTLAARWLPIVVILAFGLVILIPTWVVLPPDDEGLFTTIAPTRFQAVHLFTQYPFWNPFIGFGAPHPGAESLIFHPFVVVAHFASLAFSIGFVYQLQMWVGLISVWAVCRHLGMHRWVASVCVFTFALSSVTLSLLYNFWPDLMVAWTLSPLLLLVLLMLLESERRERRAFFAVATGLVAALMILDGHVGVFPTFGVAFVAFLLGDLRQVRRVWPWLGAAVLVFLAATSSRLYDIGVEAARSTHGHIQQVYAFDFGHFLFYPHYAGTYGPRNVAFGGVFVALALVGLVWPGVSQRHLLGLRIAAVISFVAWFLPVHWIPSLSANWLYGQPFTLFAVLLAGLALQRLWVRFPRYRIGLLALAGLQMAILAYGFYGFYRPDLQRAQDYENGIPAASLKNTFKEQPIYTYFEQQPDHASTRVLMTNGANPRLFRTLSDYTWSAWEWHGLRLVNSHVRGADLSEFQETKEALHGEIRGQPDLWEGPDDLPRANSVLDVLNVGYLLATPGERVAAGLVPVKRFTVSSPAYAVAQGQPAKTTIVVYRNPAHWPDAVIVSGQAKQLDSFSPRPGCAIPGLLCDDLSPIVALRRPGVTAQSWNGTTLDVRLAPSTQTRVLMVSQLYRPGWRAKLSDGRTIGGYRLFGGVTGFDIPAGVTYAQIYFHPTARIVFAGLSWGTVLVSALFLIVTALLGWHSRKPAQDGG